MKVTLKLYASLSDYLPEKRNGNQVDIEVAAGASPLQILEQHGVPFSQVHLVLVNGVFAHPGERGKSLATGDQLAVWPAVAGG